MYSAIFYKNATILKSVVKSKPAGIIQVHPPFNMLVIDSETTIPGKKGDYKSVINFPSLDAIPSNRAVITVHDNVSSKGIKTTYFNDVVLYLQEQKITVIQEFRKFRMLIIEIPNMSFSLFKGNLEKLTSVKRVEQDYILKTKTRSESDDEKQIVEKSFNSNEWHLTDIQAKCAWKELSPYPETGCNLPEIAVIGGAIFPHPDLIGRLSGDCEPGSSISYNWNCVNNNSDVSIPQILIDIDLANPGITPSWTNPNNGDTGTYIDWYAMTSDSIAGIIACNRNNTGIYSLKSVIGNYARVQILRVTYAHFGYSNYYTDEIINFESSFSLSSILLAADKMFLNPRCVSGVISLETQYTVEDVDVSIQYLIDAFQILKEEGRQCKGIPVYTSPWCTFANYFMNALTIPALYAVGASQQDFTLCWEFINMMSQSQLLCCAPGHHIPVLDLPGNYGFSNTFNGITINFLYSLGVPSLVYEPNASLTPEQIFIQNSVLAQIPSSHNDFIPPAIVAGVVAGMIIVNPSLRIYDINQIINQTSFKTTGINDDYVYVNGFNQYAGYGIIRMCDAIQAAEEYTSDSLDLSIDIINLDFDTWESCSNNWVAFIVELSGIESANINSIQVQLFANSQPVGNINNPGYYPIDNNIILNVADATVISGPTDYLSWTYEVYVPSPPALSYATHLCARVISAFYDNSCLTPIPIDGPIFSLPFTYDAYNCKKEIIKLEYQYHKILPALKKIRFRFRVTNLVGPTTNNSNLIYSLTWTAEWLASQNGISNIQNYTGVSGNTAPIGYNQSRIIDFMIDYPEDGFPDVFTFKINTVNYAVPIVQLVNQSYPIPGQPSVYGRLFPQ